MQCVARIGMYWLAHSERIDRIAKNFLELIKSICM